MKRLLPIALALLACQTASAAAPTHVLWQIGKPDNKNAEFALAPGGYAQFQSDAIFLVGQSDPKRDWPYVHPGPTDSWAGRRPHIFTILFGLASPPASGGCRLVLDLLDTQSTAPPWIDIVVNGTRFSRDLPAGAGDASIYGQPDKGRRHQCIVEFPASLLNQGNNRIYIKNIARSWLLYDCVTLETPDKVQSIPVATTAELLSAQVMPDRIQRDHKEMLRIAAQVACLGPAVRASFTLDGRPQPPIELTRGQHSIDLLVPAGDRVQNVPVALSVAGEECGRQDVVLTPGLREVIVVFKTHFDIGYTQLAREVVDRYRTSMIDKALDVCDAAQKLPPNERFAWTIPGWPLQQILWPGQTPQRRHRIQQAIRDGFLVWHALPFTMHTELLELEDLVRGFGFSSRLSRSEGQPLARDAKMTDVACHAWVLPTLLKHAGVDFFHLGCNSGVAPARVPTLFWWEGPDGSRLLTMYSYGYGSGLMPPVGWPHKTWLALIHTGDNHGPPTPDELGDLFREARQRLPGVHVRVGRLSDFSDAILAEKPHLPVVRGDMPDTWIHGPMSDPQGARLARQVRPRIAATETLATQLGLWGVPLPDAAVSSKVAAAYEQSLLYGEHTWGGALYWITSYSGKIHFPYGQAWKDERAQGRFERIEESWAEHSAYIHSAHDLIQPTLDRQLQSLADAVHANGTRIVVYNPLPWRRDGLVRLPNQSTSTKALKPLDGDEICPVENRDGQFLLLAQNLPALGYRTYVPAEPKLSPSPLHADPATATIESPFFRLAFNKAQGTIRSLIDKRTSRELVDPGAERGFGQYVYERMDANRLKAFVDSYSPTKPDWALIELGKPNVPPADKVPYHAAAPQDFQLRIAQSSVALTAVFHSKPSADLPYPVTTRFTLYANLPCVDVELTLHQKPADPWPEAGWLALPFAVQDPRFLLGRQNSLIDPARDIVPGANRHLFTVTSGLAILDPHERGIGLCAPDNPLVSLDRPGCWRYSLDFVPQKPTVYVNLFNNQFTSNFRLWNEGTITARVRIWAVDHFNPESDLMTPSYEARMPLLVAGSDASPGSLPPAQSGLELSRKGVQLGAFGPNPDGDGILLRLWEQAGQDGPCTVTLPAALGNHNAKLCNLRGQPIPGKITIHDGHLDLPLTHFAPTTVLLTP